MLHVRQNSHWTDCYFWRTRPGNVTQIKVPNVSVMHVTSKSTQSTAEIYTLSIVKLAVNLSRKFVCVYVCVIWIDTPCPTRPPLLRSPPWHKALWFFRLNSLLGAHLPRELVPAKRTHSEILQGHQAVKESTTGSFSFRQTWEQNEL